MRIYTLLGDSLERDSRIETIASEKTVFSFEFIV